MKNPWVIIAVIAVFLIVGSVLYSSSVTSGNNEGITFTDHFRGNETAVVTLTEYSDFQCPACASFQPLLVGLQEEFGDDLRIEFKHFPLTTIHPYAEPAARAAEAAAQQDAFFAYHDLLFANQNAWSNSPNPNAFFMQYASDLNLDIDQFKRQLNASLIKDKVKSDAAAARILGLTSTPSFFLNGEKMTISTFEDFAKQIAQAINSDVTFGVQ